MTNDLDHAERFEEMLWIALMCNCAKCDAWIDLEEIEPGIDDNSLEWAKAATKVAMQLGGTSPAELRSVVPSFLCPKCSAKRETR